ncbi:MAG: START-like domain-containing protein [Bacteroidota bacterium]
MAKKSKVVGKKATKPNVKKSAAPKKAASKKAVVKKGSSPKAAKKTVKTSPSKKGVKKVVKKVEKNAVKKAIKKVAIKPVKTVAKKVTPKKDSKSIAKAPSKKAAAKAIVAKSIPTKQKTVKEIKKVEVAPVVQPKSKQVEKIVKTPTPTVTVKATLSKNKVAVNHKSDKADAKQKSKVVVDDKPEPLQAKAAKVMKDLEETMDLNKVRPRLQAGSTPPKPIRHKEPPLKLVEPTNTQKVKYSLEFEFRSSPKILFNSVSDSSGLAGWFADEVQTKDDIYTFYWDQGSSQAKMVAMQEPRLIRFQWLEDTDGTYFQFEIKEDDITADIALIITDFAMKGEKETQIRLWESQIQQLKMFVGSL